MKCNALSINKLMCFFSEEFNDALIEADTYQIDTIQNDKGDEIIIVNNNFYYTKCEIASTLVQTFLVIKNNETTKTIQIPLNSTCTSLIGLNIRISEQNVTKCILNNTTVNCDISDLILESSDDARRPLMYRIKYTGYNGKKYSTKMQIGLIDSIKVRNAENYINLNYIITIILLFILIL